MRNSWVKYISLSTVVILGIIIIVHFLKDPTTEFITSEPGLDNRGKGIAELMEIKIGEFFEEFSSQTESNLNETWPRFRGEQFDNISKSTKKLIRKFENNTVDSLWSVQLGEGHAGAAIYKAKVYVLDYDEEIRSDMLRCFSLTKGTELWRRWYKVPVKRNHGMSRTVPAVNEDFILTIGPRCHVMCIERKSGNFLWGIDIQKEYESEVPLWYTGQCPLIDNGVAIIAPGGKALMIGIDCKSGEKLWETPNPDAWKMSHSSIMLFQFGGKKMYVYSAVGGIVAVSAEEESLGEVLWKSSVWNHSVVAPSPICMPDGKIFLTAGYGAGSMVLQLLETNGNFSVEVLQEYKPNEGLACEQQSPIFFNGKLFGIIPKDGGSMRNRFVCVDPSDCTSILWSSDKETRFGLGPYILADDKFYVLNDDASLYILEASSEKYIQLDKVELFEGHDAWAPLAIADGYMVLRDAEKMICIDLNDN